MWLILFVIILFTTIYMQIPTRQMDDKTLQTFMMGIAEDAQLTSIPPIANETFFRILQLAV